MYITVYSLMPATSGAEKQAGQRNPTVQKDFWKYIHQRVPRIVSGCPLIRLIINPSLFSRMSSLKHFLMQLIEKILGFPGQKFSVNIEWLWYWNPFDATLKIYIFQHKSAVCGIDDAMIQSNRKYLYPW